MSIKILLIISLIILLFILLFVSQKKNIPQKKNNISFCITLKNRFHPVYLNKKTNEKFQLNLFENNLRSLFRLQKSSEKWQFCITDWGSTDCKNGVESEFYRILNEENPKGLVECNIKYINSDKKFSRGFGRDEAAKLAKYNTLFFLDADMKLTDRKLLDNIYKYFSKSNHKYFSKSNHKVYFPICSSYIDITHKRYKERPTGFGNMIIDKRMFRKKPGGWLVKYSWGGEDDEMYSFFKKNSIRNYVESFFHQWHPTVHQKDIISINHS